VRVPATALTSTNQGAQLAVLGSDNKVIFKRVKIGRDFGDSVEVISGLGPQDRVIDSPAGDAPGRRHRPTGRSRGRDL
jgi:multidrug efflux pump subunit AcrA (membrane-fusion protein)